MSVGNALALVKRMQAIAFFLIVERQLGGNLIAPSAVAFANFAFLFVRGVHSDYAMT